MWPHVPPAGTRVTNTLHIHREETQPCVCTHLYVCVHTCFMCVCACIHVRVHAVCLLSCVSLCVRLCMLSACVRARLGVSAGERSRVTHVCVHTARTWTRVCLCVCMCICVHVCEGVHACVLCLRVYKCARAHVCRRLHPAHETENVYVSNRQRPSLLRTGLLEAATTSVTRRSKHGYAERIPSSEGSCRELPSRGGCRLGASSLPVPARRPSRYMAQT